jgi:hypothetical protein
MIADRPESTIPAIMVQLSFSGSAGAGGLGSTVAAREFLDAAGGVDELLFPGEKRMAGRADADFDVPLGRASVIDSTAGAGDVGLEILWMNVRFHVWKRVANLGALPLSRKG